MQDAERHRLVLGEAELHPLVLACSMGIGLRQLFQDLGEAQTRVSMDAIAGMAMAKRQGLGTAKHSCTQYLWVQERIQAKDFDMRKVGADENLADLMTKPLTEAPMHVLLSHIGFVVPVA